MKTAILFDLDGTLLDTLGDLHASTNAVLRQFGYPERTMEEVRQFVGNGARRLIEQAVPVGEETRVDEVLSAFQTYYAAHCDILTRPYPGIPELLTVINLAHQGEFILTLEPHLVLFATLQSLEVEDATEVIATNKAKDGAEGYAMQYNALCDVLKGI